jgi:hypothetical protein
MNIAMEQTDELVNGKVTNSFGGEQRVFRSAAALSLFSDAFIRGNNGARELLHLRQLRCAPVLYISRLS